MTRAPGIKRSLRWSAGAAVTLLFGAHALADQGGYVPEVQWSVALHPDAPLAAGGSTALQIHGDISVGWHVYALTEPPGGPTALRIKVDADHRVAEAVGRISAPKPVRKHDRSFDLDTETYSGKFDLRIPVKIRADLATGHYAIPVSIRFQSCSAEECRPPRTVQLVAAVDLAPHS